MNVRSTDASLYRWCVSVYVCVCGVWWFILAMVKNNIFPSIPIRSIQRKMVIRKIFFVYLIHRKILTEPNCTPYVRWSTKNFESSENTWWIYDESSVHCSPHEYGAAICINRIVELWLRITLTLNRDKNNVKLNISLKQLDWTVCFSWFFFWV